MKEKPTHEEMAATVESMAKDIQKTFEEHTGFNDVVEIQRDSSGKAISYCLKPNRLFKCLERSYGTIYYCASKNGEIVRILVNPRGEVKSGRIHNLPNDAFPRLAEKDIGILEEYIYSGKLDKK
ncbi:MAG: hypothetical protein WC976_05960 [Caldisericia bacterium]